jgi:hypothetical protein
MVPNVSAPRTAANGAEAQETSPHDFATDHAVGRKRIATLTARAALAGFSVTRLDDGQWLVAKWGLGRELADLDAVEAFIAHVSVRRA